MLKNFKYFDKPIKIVAHRGDSKFYPENSKVAFESAIRLGVDVIETDVHMSSDGVVFIWHDNNIAQINGDIDDISKKSWDELKKLDAGSVYTDSLGGTPFKNKNIFLMTFDDALQEFPEARFNVDLKDKNIKLVNEFYNILLKHAAFHRVLVASFHSYNLRAIRKLSNEIATSYGQTEVLKCFLLSKLGILNFFSKKLLYAPVFQVPVSFKGIQVVTKSFIKILHKNNIKIQVWTINNSLEMENLFKLGVDGIMTDDPRLLISVVNS